MPGVASPALLPAATSASLTGHRRDATRHSKAIRLELTLDIPLFSSSLPPFPEVLLLIIQLILDPGDPRSCARREFLFQKENEKIAFSKKTNNLCIFLARKF